MLDQGTSRNDEAEGLSALPLGSGDWSLEMLSAVLDQSSDCIKVIGPTGTLDFMNRNGRCAMHIDDFNSVAGLPWWELWPPESQSLVKDAVERVRRGENHRFEAYCPTAKGAPRWWEVSASPLRDGNGDLRGIISVSRNITERVRAHEIRDAAVEEIRHRLQNAYTLIGALVTATARGSDEREAFARETLERLQRLGAAQQMLLDPGRDGPVPLRTLVERLTRPFAPPGCDFTIATMPDCLLTEDSVRALALALGELGTNSSKYGAFGRGGSVTLSATLTGSELVLIWSERAASDRSAVAPPGSGKGLRLIERALQARGGRCEMTWIDDRLEARITLPND
ncbi:PAS domain S-box protein [Sphingomonas ginkgonis]|uniref:histidine kinase n=1 Tax=Sphingomonas ginkgonis TaxID=2315330 RepID=A0A429VDD6_9SPHN|nr:PAS domain-containing protein [Sphingomonas ginkgonis]RST31842.1 PAS domain S-box protein [Sphingomonas ginkgonis]